MTDKTTAQLLGQVIFKLLEEAKVDLTPLVQVDDGGDLLGVAEAAHLLSISEKSVRRLYKGEVIYSFMHAGQRVAYKRDLRRWKEENDRE